MLTAITMKTLFIALHFITGVCSPYNIKHDVTQQQQSRLKGFAHKDTEM